MLVPRNSLVVLKKYKNQGCEVSFNTQHHPKYKYEVSMK